MADRPPLTRLSQALWPIAASALALLAFFSVGRTFLWSFTLDLGTMVLPAVRQTYVLFFWTLLGSVAAGVLAVGLVRLQALAPRVGWPAAGRRDATWLAVTMAAAFLIACAIRAFVLRGADVTDDESAYRFMAQVLASGRLWVDSHPMKAFFDRIFMINDGKFYGQYFIGWPALMAPGVFLGATGYMNAFYSALTVPAVFLTVRRLAGAAAGRAATLLYLASPMLAVGAATELSHTTCLMAAAWSVYCLLRSREAPADWRWHAGVAFCFGLGVLIRPLSTLGVGLPILAAWFVDVAATVAGRPTPGHRGLRDPGAGHGRAAVRRQSRAERIGAHDLLRALAAVHAGGELPQRRVVGGGAAGLADPVHPRER